jgi:hypothetical protein
MFETMLFVALLTSLGGILVWAYRETLSEDALEEEFIREYMIPALRESPSLSDEEDPEKK